MRERDVKIAEQSTGDSLTMNCFDCRVPRRFIPAETDPIIRYAPERELPRERATALLSPQICGPATPHRPIRRSTMKPPGCRLARPFPYRARGRDLSNGLPRDSWQIVGLGSTNRIAVYEPLCSLCLSSSLDPDWIDEGQLPPALSPMAREKASSKSKNRTTGKKK